MIMGGSQEAIAVETRIESGPTESNKMAITVSDLHEEMKGTSGRKLEL